jgi:predicted dehydrogenase
LPIRDRPVRIGILGLGQIYELTGPTYRDRDDAEIVALCDRDLDRVEQRGADWPAAARFTDLEAFLETEMDVVEILVPTPRHAEVACRVLEAGFHVNCQKPIARSVAEADRMLAAAATSGATLRIMEDYLFYEPLQRLRDVVASGEIGEPAGVHMKMVATGNGGWEVPASSWEWQVEQARDGTGILMFDDGWHKFAVARWLFGPVGRVLGWVGETPVGGGFSVDAPSTVVWEHTSGLRGVFDLTFAPDMYFRSDFYTCDERVEVTGTRGFARVNRVTARGIQEPSLVVYRDGEIREYHALGDSLRDSFRASTDHWLRWLRTGEGDLLLDAETSREVLRFVLAALDSSRRGVVPVEP